MIDIVRPKTPQSASSTSISVIVPIYNADKYLRQCLDSITNQPFENFEVVCVDDGSTDASTSILSEYAAKDSRIKVLHQENRGTHCARKSGIAAATGEWCLFLDPDDWLTSDALPRLSSILGRTKSDIVEYGFVIHAQEDRVLSVAKNLEKKFNPSPRICGRDDFFTAAFVTHEIPGHLIGKIVRASICKKIFDAMSNRRITFQEDLCALYRIVSLSDSIEVVSDRLYNYRVGDGISYRLKMSSEEFFKTFTKFEELRDLQSFCAERFSFDSAAAHALKCLEVRMAMASLSQAMERLERQDDGIEGIRRLRSICSDEIIAEACAQWFRLNGVKLAETARKYGIGDIIGDVALRQLDYVWRGHNTRLRNFDKKFAELDERLAEMQRELSSEHEKRLQLEEHLKHLEEQLKHPFRLLFRQNREKHQQQ